MLNHHCTVGIICEDGMHIDSLSYPCSELEAVSSENRKHIKRGACYQDVRVSRIIFA